jgi:hypothetical protein
MYLGRTDKMPPFFRSLFRPGFDPCRNAPHKKEQASAPEGLILRSVVREGCYFARLPLNPQPAEIGTPGARSWQSVF